MTIKNKQEAVHTVESVLRVLNAMNVSGIDNCRFIVACSNDLQDLCDFLRLLKDGGEPDGISHSKTEPD